MDVYPTRPSNVLKIKNFPDLTLIDLLFINLLICQFIYLFIYLFIFRYQDDHNQTWFLIIATMRWLGVCLDMICAVFAAFVVFLAIATQSGSGKVAWLQAHSNYAK